ncbi:MAG TPA: DNA repair protein RecN [Steroidobacteraceae bacterium]|nr:DNA repair protein RecN [Steroidobacteraceae bacterium]
MLTSIQIKDFAIIDRIELELNDGMTALTGETGAGKSILVDALLFVTGGRVGSEVIRHGCEKAEVTANFTIEKKSPVATWFNEQAIDHEGECLLRRALGNDGRSRAWVNGQSMPLQALRQLGEALVDVHGQMEYQSLMKRSAQRDLLDTNGNHQTLNDKVSASWKKLKTLRQQRAETEQSAKDRNERLTLLRYHVNELEALAVQPGEVLELNTERQRHAHSGKLASGAREVVELVREADTNAEQLLSRALNIARNLQSIDAGLNSTADLLNEALIATREAASAIQHYESSLDADPARQEWVEQRLAALETAARKHRVEIDELVAVLDNCKAEVQKLESLEFTLEQLDAQIIAAQSEYNAACKDLTKARMKTAKALSERVTTLMQTLGMPGGKFVVQLTTLDEANHSEHGADEIEFMVSANPGQPLKALAKVASGGELSRISLSIQVAAVESVANGASCPTLVFDEVDAGVGGGVAEMVGRQLRTLGDNAQVLCVTHLPQVASQAHAQVRVAKLTDGKHTRTSLETLSKEARVEEIARMLGGAQISDMARAHAAEMLNTPVKKSAKAR